MASATPVVATPAAVAALDVVDGREVAVASDQERMAARILDLLDDPRERARLGAAGRRYVEAKHDWPSIARRLTETYLDAR